VTIFVPYFGYARQDRKEMPRVPISASVVANMLEHVGADRILTLDIHSEQAQGFIEAPWDNLYGSFTLVPELKKRKLKNLVIASPDKGGMTRATGYAKLLGAEDIAIVYKERDVKLNDTSKALAMIGEVKGRDVLLVDDIIGSGSTIVNAANYLKQKGAGRVLAAATHGLFSGDALAKIEESALDEMIVTDTIPSQEGEEKSKKISRISVAPLLAEAILRIESGESISRELILDAKV
jgi:ribose-phosphate pyrophosphokinase